MRMDFKLQYLIRMNLPVITERNTRNNVQDAKYTVHA